LPAEVFGMSIGTASGNTRRTPFSLRMSHWSRRVHTPPIPVPMATPRRSGSISGEPASSIAAREAMTAYWALGSIRRTSTLVSTSSAFCCRVHAKCTGSS
jgi:hypothetical protein